MTEKEEKKLHRKTVDYFGPSINHQILHAFKPRSHRRRVGQIRPDSSFLAQISTPDGFPTLAAEDLPIRFVHVSTNKSRHAIHAVKWTPDARRVLVSSYSGEFTIWNGSNFGFESIMQAHDAPIFSLEYAHNGRWLLSGDQTGCIKFWQPNFNNVNIIQNAHENAIQGLAFSANDSKFVSCSDDQHLKVWDFTTGQSEHSFKGHHWDVKSCDWHPTKGLIVSGSKDNLVKLWDPRDAVCLATIRDFKHTVSQTKFQPKGDLLAACSRDHSTRIFDIRMMKCLTVIRTNNEADLSALTWNPVHDNVLTIGGYDGSLNHYNLDLALDLNHVFNVNSKPKQITKSWHEIPHAHEKAIYTMEYHPLGHMLCSAGADKSMRFWSRGRPKEDSLFNDSAYTGEKREIDETQQEAGELALGLGVGRLPGLSIPGLSG